jgi:hypothetical protein
LSFGVEAASDSSKAAGRKRRQAGDTLVGELVSLHSRIKTGQERVLAAHWRWLDLVDKVWLINGLMYINVFLCVGTDVFVWALWWLDLVDMVWTMYGWFVLVCAL